MLDRNFLFCVNFFFFSFLFFLFFFFFFFLEFGASFRDNCPARDEISEKFNLCNF